MRQEFRPLYRPSSCTEADGCYRRRQDTQCHQESRTRGLCLRHQIWLNIPMNASDRDLASDHRHTKANRL